MNRPQPSESRPEHQESASERLGERRLLFGLFAALVVARLAVLVPAVADLASGESGIDLEGRRGELEFALHRVDPALAALALAREVSIERHGAWVHEGRIALPTLDEMAVGAFEDGEFLHANRHLAAYPQWSYPLLLPWIWPSLGWVSSYFAVLQVLGLAAIVWLCSRRHQDAWRWLAALVCLVPMSAWAATVSTGQLSILVILGLAAYAIAIDQRRWLVAGVLLGLLSVKPTSTALFVFLLLPPVLTGAARWLDAVRSALVAGSMIVASSLLMWFWVGTDPLAALDNLSFHNTHAAHFGYGLMPTVVNRVGVDAVTATTWFTVVGVAAAVAATWFLRRQGTLVQLAAIGLLSRLWAYHRHYDDVLLLFLLLGLLALARRGSLVGAAALGSVAMTLAAPTPSSEAYALWRVGVWVLGLIVLVVEARNRRFQEGV